MGSGPSRLDTFLRPLWAGDPAATHRTFHPALADRVELPCLELMAEGLKDALGECADPNGSNFKATDEDVGGSLIHSETKTFAFPSGVTIVVCVRWQGNLVAEFTVTPATGALPTLRPTTLRNIDPYVARGVAFLERWYRNDAVKDALPLALVQALGGPDALRRAQALDAGAVHLGPLKRVEPIDHSGKLVYEGDIPVLVLSFRLHRALSVTRATIRWAFSGTRAIIAAISIPGDLEHVEAPDDEWLSANTRDACEAFLGEEDAELIAGFEETLALPLRADLQTPCMRHYLATLLPRCGIPYPLEEGAVTTAHENRSVRRVPLSAEDSEKTAAVEVTIRVEGVESTTVLSLVYVGRAVSGASAAILPAEDVTCVPPTVLPRWYYEGLAERWLTLVAEGAFPLCRDLSHPAARETLTDGVLVRLGLLLLERGIDDPEVTSDSDDPLPLEGGKFTLWFAVEQPTNDDEPVPDAGPPTGPPLRGAMTFVWTGLVAAIGHVHLGPE